MAFCFTLALASKIELQPRDLSAMSDNIGQALSYIAVANPSSENNIPKKLSFSSARRML